MRKINKLTVTMSPLHKSNVNTQQSGLLTNKSSISPKQPLTSSVKQSQLCRKHTKKSKQQSHFSLKSSKVPYHRQSSNYATNQPLNNSTKKSNLPLLSTTKTVKNIGKNITNNCGDNHRDVCHNNSTANDQNGESDSESSVKNEKNNKQTNEDKVHFSEENVKTETSSRTHADLRSRSITPRLVKTSIYDSEPEARLRESMTRVVTTHNIVTDLDRWRVPHTSLTPELSSLMQSPPLEPLAPPDLPITMPEWLDSHTIIEHIKAGFVEYEVERLITNFRDLHRNSAIQSLQLKECMGRIELLQQKLDRDPTKKKAVFIAHQYGKEKDQLEAEKFSLELQMEGLHKDMGQQADVIRRLTKDREITLKASRKNQTYMRDLELRLSKLDIEKTTLLNQIQANEDLIAKLLSESSRSKPRFTYAQVKPGMYTESRENTSLVKSSEREKAVELENKLNEFILRTEKQRKLIQTLRRQEDDCNKDFGKLKVLNRRQKKTNEKVKIISESWKNKAKFRLQQVDIFRTKNIELNKEIQENRKNEAVLKQEISNLSLKLRLCTVREESYKKQINEKANVVENVKKIGDSCMRTNMSLEKNINAKEVLIKSLTKTTHILKEQLSIAMSKLGAQNESFAELSRMFHRVDAEAMVLNTEMACKDRIIDMATHELQRGVLKVDQVTRQLQTYEQNFKDVHISVSIMEKEVDALAKRLKLLEKNKTELVKRNEQMQIEFQQRMEVINNLDWENQVQDSMIQSLSHSDKAQHQEVLRIETKVGHLQRDISKHETTIKNQNKLISDQMTEMIQLKLEISRIQAEMGVISEELRSERLQSKDAINMRDIYERNCQKHIVEKKLEQEKVKAAVQKLRDAELYVNSRSKVVRLLVHEVRHLRRSMNNQRHVRGKLEELKKQYVDLWKTHVHTQARIKAAEEIGPQNLHEARIVRAKHPSVYEMSVKIRVLTRKLIAKTTEVAQKEQLLIEKNKLYMHMRVLVAATTPLSNTRQDLVRLQKVNKQKEREIKALKGEIQFLEKFYATADNTIALKDQEIRKVKGEYFRQKRVIDKTNHNNHHHPAPLPSICKEQDADHKTYLPANPANPLNGPQDNPAPPLHTRTTNRPIRRLGVKTLPPLNQASQRESSGLCRSAAVSTTNINNNNTNNAKNPTILTTTAKLPMTSTTRQQRQKLQQQQ